MKRDVYVAGMAAAACVINVACGCSSSPPPITPDDERDFAEGGVLACEFVERQHGDAVPAAVLAHCGRVRRLAETLGAK